MKADDFIVELCPHEAALPGYLFTNPAFVAWQGQQQNKRVQSFGIFRKDSRQLYAHLTLAAQTDDWSAPITGAFGGPVMHKHVPVGALDMLMQEVIRWLKSENAKTCTLRLPPESFPDPLRAPLQNVLFRQGWTLDLLDLNYHYPVSSAEEFHAQLGATKRQETRRLRGTGAAFHPLSHQDGEKAYNIIANNRAARGYPMTMSWAGLSALAQAFPDKVYFFGVSRGDDLLASAVCLQITSGYFYVFYWGEDPAFRKEMPVLLLVDGLVDHCHKNGFKILDIGTSTEKAIPNEGLIAFKTGLGFLATSKPTYKFDFS